VHAMHDRSTPHFVDELAQALRCGPGRERQVHLVLENDHNDAARLRRGDRGEPQLADAQWNDDVHHTLHVIATGETDGYYLDFADQPLRLFGRALAEGYAYQGEPSPYRGGAARGTPSAQLPPLAFVNALQTHDQVGNRAFGERIATLDILRGFALLGILIMNMPGFATSFFAEADGSHLWPGAVDQFAEQARNMLTYAFGAEVIERIPVASLKRSLEQTVLEQTSTHL